MLFLQLKRMCIIALVPVSRDDPGVVEAVRGRHRFSMCFCLAHRIYPIILMITFVSLEGKILKFTSQSY